MEQIIYDPMGCCGEDAYRVVKCGNWCRLQSAVYGEDYITVESCRYAAWERYAEKSGAYDPYRKGPQYVLNFIREIEEYKKRSKDVNLDWAY